MFEKYRIVVYIREVYIHLKSWCKEYYEKDRQQGKSLNDYTWANGKPVKSSRNSQEEPKKMKI